MDKLPATEPMSMGQAVRLVGRLAGDHDSRALGSALIQIDGYLTFTTIRLPVERYAI
jgi:hypothetical protein